MQYISSIEFKTDKQQLDNELYDDIIKLLRYTVNRDCYMMEFMILTQFIVEFINL